MIPELSDAQKAAQQEARKVLHAYRAVFGTDEKRTDQQKLVWDDLRARARVESPVFVKDGAGNLDPLRAAVADGARMFFLQIGEFVRKDPDAIPTPPAVKK